MISWAKITKAGDNVAQWFTQQITYRGKVSRCLVVYPYGYHANAKPDNESFVLMMHVNGNAADKAGIPFNPFVRPDLAEGEVAIYQPGSDTLIKFLADGAGIEIVNSTKVNITCPEVEMSGNLIVNGNIDVEGDTTLSSTVTSNGKDISDTHTHAGSATAPDGPVTPTGAPV